MNRSESIKNIAKALQLFHVKMEPIKKDADNPFYKSRYATLSIILESIATPLQESGLIFTQFPDGQSGLTTILIHVESGEFIEATYNITPIKVDPQAHGSAITYSRRYALASILGLNIEEDDDGNAASGKTQSQTNTDKPWLNEGTPEFNNAKIAIQKGTHTINDVQIKYKVSAKTREKLLS